jgi:prolyl oligopeptidase
MRKYIATLSAIVICFTSFSQLIYPVTKKVKQVDEYFGVKVEDPYRWLETDTAAEVKNWVKEQNKVTESYLAQIPFREKIRQQIRGYNDVPYYSAPRRVGSYYFFVKNTGLQPQDVIYRQK